MNQIHFTYEELVSLPVEKRDILLKIWNELHPDLPVVFEEPATCPICTDNLTDPVDIGCGHIFCRECISSWGERGGANHDKCPVCRRPYMPLDYENEQRHLRQALEGLNYCLAQFRSERRWNQNIEEVRSRLEAPFRALKFPTTSPWDTYEMANVSIVGIRIRLGLPG